MIAPPEPDPLEVEAPSSSQVPTEIASSDDLPDSEFPQVVHPETHSPAEPQPLSRVPTERASSPVDSENLPTAPVETESSMEVDVALQTAPEDTGIVELAIPILSALSHPEDPLIERQAEEVPVPDASSSVADTLPSKEHGAIGEITPHTVTAEQASQDEVVDMVML